MSPGRFTTACPGPKPPRSWRRAWPDNRLTPLIRGRPENDLPARRQPQPLPPPGPGLPVLIRACPPVAHPCPDGTPGPGRDHQQETAMTTPRRSPRSGDDTYDLIDDALAALAERRGAWLGDDLTAITLLAS